ncbi:cupin domain-containing protein [Spirosoma endbachense]|uniref:Cupin domain-containing protein n=1 Tax=Spirosoma endbachense TaxID=2666025 RepID=A0A6P1VWE5_9BACT|nr:cupin domain-containing protein [Spirosoma endbachense]QHV95696.1 cupin domain-containing protein [Spirosoma endbachense]
MQDSFVLSSFESRTSQPYNVLGMAVYLKVAGADTAGQLSVFEAEYQKHEGPPLHAHQVDETFFITSGEFLFQTGDKRCIVKAGDTLFIPRNMPHAFLTISERGAMLFMVNPTDKVEILFERLSAYPTPPSVDEVVALHEELGLKILGGPLSAAQ